MAATTLDLRQGSLAEHLLAHNLRHRPDYVAIAWNEQKWTYRQLADRAHTLARELTDRGLRPGEVMLIESEPTPAALSALLACWIIGAVVVPIDPATPAHRRDVIIESTKPVGIASQRPEQDATGLRLTIDLQRPEGRVCGRLHPERREPIAPPDTAYVLFTSGTTGTPKGIMMSHRAAIAFLTGVAQQVELPSTARLASYTSLTFDIFLIDWGIAAAAGAMVIQVPRTLLQQPQHFVDYLRRHSVTMVSGVPSAWTPVLRSAANELAACLSLDTVQLAGEGYPTELVHELRRVRPGLRVINGYGQSETIGCSFLSLPDPLPSTRTKVPIGPPHPGAEFIVVDDTGRRVAPGGTGELYLRSSALFSGYWQDDNATSRALVPAPDEPGSSRRVLRTGDMMRLENDGWYTFAGRVDHRVKVNGNRIELEEVEGTIAAHPDVEEAAAVVLQDDDHARLVALVTLGGTAADHTMEDLAGHCHDRLPQYMVPSPIFVVAELPRNTNGKLDRRHAQQLASQAMAPSFQQQ